MRNRKIPVAIIGTGNIGSDLLIKVQRSRYLTCTLFTGKNPQSAGIARAKEMGIPVSYDSVRALTDNPKTADIVFDATNAEQHCLHAPVLRRLKKFVIDMTPSKIGTLCVPIVNLKEGVSSWNVSMISCGGQANIPVIKAVTDMCPGVPYVEVVSSISSKSAGIGTRNNIDEYTQTTSDAIVALAGVPRAKTIIILNPADPPILMHNTVYVPMAEPDMERISTAVSGVISRITRYVPGFSLITPPFYDHGRVTIMTQVVGLGDFLPVFAGNLDIINCAAVAVAEAYAKKRLQSKA